MTEMIKILYNDCYGGVEFSKAFEAEYKARTGRELKAHQRLYRTGPDSIRCDPVAIAIFEEKGSEWCSGDHSILAIRKVPKIFERYWEVDEYDGDETVRVNRSEALADCLHAFMASGDKATLETQYRAIMDTKLPAVVEEMEIDAPPPLPEPATWSYTGLAAGAAAPPASTLLPTVTFYPASFHSQWEALPVAKKLHGNGPTPSDVEGSMRAASLFPLASGDTGSTLKWFLYGQEDTTTAYVFLEVIFEKLTGDMAVAIKSESASAVSLAEDAIRAVFPVAPLLNTEEESPPVCPQE